MDDIVVAGAGPAGSLTALLLARQGLRVRLLERERFPRDKLCGDTLNPGALRVLARHVDLGYLDREALPIEGMLLTGPNGVSVHGRYGKALVGRSLTRRALDGWLLEQALAAGVQFEDGVTVTGPVVDASSRVTGVRLRTPSRANAVIDARLVIGADGRRSALAAGVQISHQPARPRRWAVGAYFEGVRGLQPLGEMHIRRGRYIGVAPLPAGIANACLVEPLDPGRGTWRDPAARLRAAIDADPLLAPRFQHARAISAPVVLGPMAVDVTQPGVPGLLLAGDAAGFIDPMTGDGLRYALAGAELAASVAAEVLAGTLAIVRSADVLAARRRRTLSAKWRFNRVMRRLVAWPAGVSAAAALARAVPNVFEALIRYAGDVDT